MEVNEDMGQIGRQACVGDVVPRKVPAPAFVINSGKSVVSINRDYLDGPPMHERDIQPQAGEPTSAQSW